jgi:hypothetical protein
MNTCEKCNKEIIPEYNYHTIITEQTTKHDFKSKIYCFKCLGID